MNSINRVLKFIFSFIIIVICLFTSEVKAYDLVELDDYGVYCGYRNSSNNFYYFKVLVDYDGQKWEFDDAGESFAELGVCIECDRPSGAITMSDKTSIDWFIEKGILTVPLGKENYHWTCPNKPFGVEGLTLDEQGCNSKNCSTDIIPTVEEFNKPYTCNYTSVTTGSSLKIDYHFDKDKGHTWVVSYPDNTTKTYINNETNGNFMPSETCEDIYYTSTDKKINVAIYSNQGNVTLDKLCDTYQESTIEHFCSGSCNYGSVKCPKLDAGDNGSCPSELRPIIKFIKLAVFDTIQLVVPILLIVMGTIDFVKAVIATDDKVNKDAISKFIRRCLSAIAIFFIVTIVTVIMDMFAKTDVGKQNDWKSCWQNID